mmetsp:Transcript_1875/g.4286  ORF Transcript_1875/g.4286 Transcript_1875/m.4286 type:complete len:314 (-) Transcript_1875:98-1039(-)
MPAGLDWRNQLRLVCEGAVIPKSFSGRVTQQGNPADVMRVADSAASISQEETAQVLGGVSAVDLCSKLNEMSAESIGEVGEVLAFMPRLESLRLTGSRLDTPEKAQALLPALTAMTGLQELYLEDCGIGIGWLEPLLPALMGMQQLQMLMLDDNRLRARGAKALLPLLSQAKQIELLGLESNAIGAEGMTALAPALRDLPRVRALYLTGNNLGSAGTTQLAPVLMRMPLLEDLYLAGNALGAEELEVLMPALLQMTALREFLVDAEPEELLSHRGQEVPPAVAEQGGGCDGWLLLLQMLRTGALDRAAADAAA